MTAAKTPSPECVMCAALLTADEVRAAGGEPYLPGCRPAKPRPTVSGGPRSRVCKTHEREKRKATRAKRHDSRVVKVYGLGPGEYEHLLAAQGGTCAFPRCPASGKRKRLAVDHDHDTGEVRGLLCGPHNHALLGKFAGDLHDAIAYLADPPARHLRSAS